VKANTILQCIIFIKYYIQNAKITAIALFVIMTNRVIILEQRKAFQKINEMNSIFHIIRLTSLSVIIGYSIILNNVTGWKIPRRTGQKYLISGKDSALSMDKNF